MAHVELGLDERRQIERLRLARMPVARIAARLRRHRSTIYRELRRNRFVDEELPELDGYWSLVAHDMATGRRRRRRKLARMPALLVAIADRLRAGWSPEQIAGRLRLEGGPAYVSHETIYAWVYSKEGQDRGLARHLPSRRRRRRSRHGRKPRGAVFPPERAIRHRPKAVAGRRAFGHWEGDLMIFRREHGEANVASLVERKTRFAVLLRNPDRRSAPLMDRLVTALAPLPREARRSITFDRGLEFAAWRELDAAVGTKAWFCDPQAPWQKGAVENLNRRARRWLPRDTPVAGLADDAMRLVCERLNTTPRKCLSYRTPAEAFRAEMRRIT